MRFITLITLLFATTLASAQDNIVLRNGEEIPAKVLEINQIELKYRKVANPDGPLYTAPLRDVLFIKYANGTKDSFGTEQPRQMARPGMLQPGVPRPGRARPGRRARPGAAGPGQMGAAGPQAAATPGLDGLRYHSGLFSRYYSSAGGQRIDMTEAGSLFATQPDASRAFNRGRSLRTWSIVTAVPAVVLIGAGVGLAAFEGMGGDGRGRNGSRFDRMDASSTNDPTDNDNDRMSGRGGDAFAGAAVAGTGVLLGVASVWLGNRANVQFRRAASRYNGRANTSLHFMPSRQGLGVGAVLTF